MLILSMSRLRSTDPTLFSDSDDEGLEDLSPRVAEGHDEGGNDEPLASAPRPWLPIVRVALMIRLLK
jgi:hypothetical protein